MSVTAVSPLLLQRYELKYLIPMSMVEPISQFLECHCSMDYYSQIAPDHFYVINSLYFDTEWFEFLKRKVERIEPTWSMRVRSYGHDPKPPFYTEIKLKVNDFTNKMRAKIDADDWALMLQTGDIPAGIDARSRSYLEHFIWLINTYAARPRVLTQYRRKAYLSDIDLYARVTFDRDLRFQPEEGFNVTPDEKQMCHYDHEEIYPHPEQNVILELKCEKQVPLWMIQMIKKFELTRNGFSKYGTCVLETMVEQLPPFDLQSKFHSRGLMP